MNVKVLLANKVLYTAPFVMLSHQLMSILRGMPLMILTSVGTQHCLPLHGHLLPDQLLGGMRLGFCGTPLQVLRQQPCEGLVALW